MPRRIRNRLKFALERWVLRGPQYRLLFIAAVIGLVSILGGALVYGFGEGFEDPWGAVWWAFLRLTDPGYLGDDEGAFVRTVSTIVTVLGYVLFLGALVAIMTQWLNEKMELLESGLTPLAKKNHVLILGWTNRTATIVQELRLADGRVRRFLQRHGERALHVVVLAETVSTALVQELRDQLGRLWDERRITLRSGTALRMEHLRRVDFANAATIILPATDFASGGTAAADTRAIKTLVSLSNSPGTGPEPGRLPPAVAEIFDARKIDLARSAYDGPIEILASDAIVSRLIAQTVRHRGLSHVYGELLTHGRGNEVYVRDAKALTGRTVADCAGQFPTAILLGLVRPSGRSFESVLNPPGEVVVGEGERLVLLARSFEDSEPAESPRAAIAATVERHRRASGSGGVRRVLVIGWSHKVPALLHEFDSYPSERFEIDLLSSLSLDKREAALARHDLRLERVTVRQRLGDYTVPSDLRKVEPASFDNVVFLGSDRLESGAESDARTILGYLLLREALPAEGGPAVLIELLDAGNATLFRRRRGEVLISPLILSHMVAQVALRPELRAVFDELFGPGGSEIFFRPSADYGVEGRETTFAELEALAAARGEVALGVRTGGASSARGGVALNPARTRRFNLGAGDEVVALSTYE